MRKSFLLFTTLCLIAMGGGKLAHAAITCTSTATVTSPNKNMTKVDGSTDVTATSEHVFTITGGQPYQQINYAYGYSLSIDGDATGSTVVSDPGPGTNPERLHTLDSDGAWKPRTPFTLRSTKNLPSAEHAFVAKSNISLTYFENTNVDGVDILVERHESDHATDTKTYMTGLTSTPVVLPPGGGN